MTGNGEPSVLYECAHGCGAKFTTLNDRFSHEPSCPRNPNRVDERENPER